MDSNIKPPKKKTKTGARIGAKSGAKSGAKVRAKSGAKSVPDWESLASVLEPAVATVHDVANTNGFFLAGGTGLAIILRHRLSDDLDFFKNVAFESEKLASLLRSLDPTGEQGLISKSTVYWFAGGDKKQKISFIAAQGRESRVENRVVFGHQIQIASILDIAAMKSVAIIGRVEKKDYVDFAAILHYGKITLNEILVFNEVKLRGTHYNAQTFLRSLAYFDDVESLPMPIMTSDMSWKDSKRIISQAVMSMLNTGC